VAGAANSSLHADLAFLREEEKLARDVYVQLYDRWRIRAFDNISGSEQRHMNHVAMLFPSRGIQDPVRDDSAGAFTDETFTELYAELTQAGVESEVDALRVGARIEDLDIRDIEQMLTRTDDAEVQETYRLLLCGSRNHMRAFTRLLQARGEAYAPQYISSDRYEEIVRGDHERCGRLFGQGLHGRGMGRGRGMGQGACASSPNDCPRQQCNH